MTSCLQAVPAPAPSGEHSLANADECRRELQRLGELFGVGRRTTTAVPPPPPELGSRAARDELLAVLEGEYAAVKKAVREVLAGDAAVFQSRTELRTLDERRDDTMAKVRTLVRELVVRRRAVRLSDVRDNLGRIYAVLDIIGYTDNSFYIMFFVQYLIWGGSVLKLGTERHAHLLPAIESLELPGCFAMTELGHGTNVAGIETTATYDAAAGEFVVHTPTRTAAKFWIGGSAKFGRMATVFVRLVVAGVDRGVHALLVPLRDEQHRVLPGVRIVDIGWKEGHNGADNGMLLFENVRVPRTNLLNRYSDVLADGSYASTLADAGDHFRHIIEALSSERASRSGCAKLLIAIGVRYAFARRQFGAPQPAAGGGGALQRPREVPLITYVTHQRRLMPVLAATVLNELVFEHVWRTLRTKSDENFREMGVLQAGMKLHGSWAAIQAAQTVRECCGGQGYRAANLIAGIKADVDLAATGGGDNTVLAQVIAKFLLDELRAQTAAGTGYSGALAYLADDVDPATSAAAAAAAAAQQPLQLHNAEWHQQLLRVRERTLLFQLAGRLLELTSGGDATNAARLSRWDAWQLCTQHCKPLALAYVRRNNHAIVVARIAAAPERFQPLLRELLALHTLCALQDDLAFYVTAGLLPATAASIQAIDDEITRLCLRLAPLSLDLVHTWDIPEALLPPANLMDDMLRARL